MTTGPLPGIFLPLTIPASWLYGRVVAARNARFNRGVGIESIDRPVVSIGNITTGGTGKTPMVAWIAEQLIAAGHRPAIAMRGYQSQGGVSDEQAEYAQRLPDVPVIANPDRIGALRAFLPQHPEIDCVLLDDGFQHRRLKRDLDLVLIDATADTLNDRLLPAGNLREPIGNVRRADGVILTHADDGPSHLKSQISNLKLQIERIHGRPPLAASRHVWTDLSIYRKNENGESVPVIWLQSKRVLTLLGVARPRHVIDQLQAAGANIAADIPCGDHEQYDRAKITVARGLCSGGDAMVVTAKDWVKLRDRIELKSWPVPVVVPQLKIEVFEGAEQLRSRVLAAVRAGKPAR